MTSSQRLRIARRHAGLSQSALARAVGVQRSAVSHWERGSQPAAGNLREVALATGAHYEWLATGRGAMVVSDEILMDSIMAVDAMLVDDALELRMIEAIRSMTPLAKVALIEVAEQLALLRRGRKQRA